MRERKIIRPEMGAAHQMANPEIDVSRGLDRHPLPPQPLSDNQCPAPTGCARSPTRALLHAVDVELPPIQAVYAGRVQPTPCASCVQKGRPLHSGKLQPSSPLSKLARRLELRRQDFVADSRRLLLSAIGLVLQSAFGTLAHNEKETFLISMGLLKESLTPITPLRKGGKTHA